MKIEIENVYILDWNDNKELQSFFLTLELLDNTIENVDKWDNIFHKLSGGKKLKMIIDNEE